MLRAVECMFKIVTDYYTNLDNFALFRAKCNETIKKAQPNDFYVQDANTLIYKNKYYINLFSRWASLVGTHEQRSKFNNFGSK